MLAAAPPQLVLGVGGAGERYTAPRLGEPPGKSVNLRVAYIPIVLAGGADAARFGARPLSGPGATGCGRAGVAAARGARRFAAHHAVRAAFAEPGTRPRRRVCQGQSRRIDRLQSRPRLRTGRGLWTLGWCQRPAGLWLVLRR